MIHKGVVLAGGTGSRLAPATNVTNKHLLPVGGDPMIYYPIRSLVQEGVSKILVTLGGNAVGDVVRVLAEEPEFESVEFTFRYQRRAGGIAEALGLAEDFVGDDRFCVFLGDNILLGGLGDAFADFSQDAGAGAMVFLKEVRDPQRFGVAVIDGGRIVRVLEKPKSPPSNLAIIGVYLYTPDVFSVARSLNRSARRDGDKRRPVPLCARGYAQAPDCQERLDGRGDAVLACEGQYGRPVAGEPEPGRAGHRLRQG